MAIKIADIFAKLDVDDSSYNAKMGQAQGKAGAFGNALQGIFQGIGQRIFSGIVDGLETVVSKMGDAVQASSNLNESMNQVGQIFGSSAQKVIDFASTADTALGQSKRQALDAAATFATFGKSAGLSGDELVSFSTKFDTLASDMASFKNTTPEQAITAIGAALRGEGEPIRKYGVLLDEATLKHRALALGIISTTDQALTPQQKVLAATAEIYRQTTDIQGDFARTSEGLANAQRRLAAEFENGSASLGNTFRPAVESITNALVDLAPQMFQYAQAAMDQFANGLADGIRAIIPVITTVRQLLAYWFAPGSPPRVAPDIDKWGAAAMGQFFKGFTSVDIKSAISGIGSAIENILRSDVSAGKADELGLVGRVLGSQSAIVAAVAEFKNVGSVSESTLQRIARSAGSAGAGIANLVKAYFDVQKASDAAARAQEELNRITEKYDAIINPLQGKLDNVRAEQQRLADQQRLIAARNTLNNFDSTAAEKRAAQLEIEQISLEQQISTAEQQKKLETDKAQATVDGAKKQQDAAQKQLDIAQATIDQQVRINNLLGEQRQLEERLAQQRKAEAEKQQRLAEQLHQAQLQYNLSLADTSGKIAILRGELANTAAGSAEYYGIQQQIAALEKQQAAEQERVTDAQFEYNLSLTDTAGKIALYQEKLAGVKQGSVEYYDILTKIHELEVRRQKELDKLGGADLGAKIDTNFTRPIQETTEATQNLTKAVREFFKEFEKPTEKKPEVFVGNQWDTAINQLKGGVDTPVKDEPPPFIKRIVDYIKQIFLPAMDGMGVKIGEIVEFFKTKFPEILAPIQKTIDDLIKVIEERFPIIKKDSEETASGLTKIWQEHGDILGVWWKLLWSDITVVLTGAIDIITGVFTAFVGVFTLNWKTWTDGLKLIATGFWVIISGLFVNELARIKANFDEFFPGVLASVEAGLTNLLAPFNKFITELGAWRSRIDEDLGAWFSGLGTKFYNAGASLIKNLRDGINALLPTLPDWMKNSFGKLTDLLPGSEPKDSSSPFARLDKRGMAFVENFQKGIEAASLNINPLSDSLLAPVTNNSSTANNMTFNINIGGGDVTGIKQGAKDGILEALRSAGLR